MDSDVLHHPLLLFLDMQIPKNTPDYMEQEDIEFYLAEQLYDLGKVATREGADEYAKNSVCMKRILNYI